MAHDLLSTIRGEIDARLKEMRPLMAEYEQLLVAADALAKEDQASAAVTSATKPRATRPRKAKERAGAASKPAKVESQQAAPVEEASAPSSADEPKPARAARGAAREAILAALDHGSHTVAELVVVTAMSGPNVNGNLRRLYAEGAITKTEREGKTAWALPGAAS